MKKIYNIFLIIIRFFTYPFRYVGMAFNLMKIRKRELQARLKAWDEFKEKHNIPIMQWYKQHGNGVQPPIYYNQKDQKFYWNNRLARRKLIKVAKKGHKKMVSKRNAQARLEWKNKGSHLKVVK